MIAEQQEASPRRSPPGASGKEEPDDVEPIEIIESDPFHEGAEANLDSQGCLWRILRGIYGDLTTTEFRNLFLLGVTAFFTMGANSFTLPILKQHRNLLDATTSEGHSFPSHSRARLPALREECLHASHFLCSQCYAYSKSSERTLR